MTLAELEAWVRRQTVTDTNTLADADLDLILQQGLLDIATRYEWPWCYATDTISLVNGTTTYALPTDVMWIKALIHDGEGAGARLASTTLEAIKAEYGDSVGDTDLPDRYYLEGSQVTFVPTPNVAKTVNVHYFATPDLTAFDADAEEPPFHSAFHIALAEFASSYIWEEREEEERASFYFSRYLDTVGRMASFYDVILPAAPLIVGGGTLQDRLRLFDNYLAV